MQVLKGKYTNASIYASIIESEAYDQIRNLCDQESMTGSHVAIMPDTHAGAGCTIGTTMTIGDKVIPNLVGVDIGCGMEVIKLKEKNINLPELDSVIRQYVPSGFNTRSTIHRYLSNTHINNLVCKDKLNMERIELSLGTLGGGNHFIEVDIDDNGSLYLVIHSGSRYLGVQVAKYYQDKAYDELKNSGLKEACDALIVNYKMAGKEKEIAKGLMNLKKLYSNTDVPRELAYVYEESFNEYIHDMRIAQEYATWNRNAMADTILKKTGLHMKDRFTTIHNYIDMNNMILRKGAVSAQAGELLIIPINMRDGSLICRGKGNPDWNYSAPHGAGRLMSRSKAKESFTVSEFKKTMQESGIYTTSVGQGTLDECPMTYKPMDVIERDIQDTVEIVGVIKPIYNFKASEDGETKAERFERLRKEKRKEKECQDIQY